jgi:hypothetical protein
MCILTIHGRNRSTVWHAGKVVAVPVCIGPLRILTWQLAMHRVDHADTRVSRILLMNHALMSLLLSTAPVPRPLAFAFDLGWVRKRSSTHIRRNARF